MKVVTLETIAAAMSAVERDTIQRCADVARIYGADRARKAQSRLATAKVKAADEVAALIEKLPPRPVNLKGMLK